MGEITEGLMGDGACILEEGMPLSINEIKSRLRDLYHTKAELEEAREILSNYVDIVEMYGDDAIDSIIIIHNCTQEFLSNQPNKSSEE